MCVLCAYVIIIIINGSAPSISLTLQLFENLRLMLMDILLNDHTSTAVFDRAFVWESQNFIAETTARATFFRPDWWKS